MKKQLTLVIGILILVASGICFAEEASEVEEVSYEEGSYETSPQFNPIVLDEGEIAPVDGMLIDENTAIELNLLRASTLRLQTELEVRLRLWQEQETIYEDALGSLQGQVETLMTEIAGQETSWWDRYGVVVLGTVGFVIGAAVTILVAWAIDEAV